MDEGMDDEIGKEWRRVDWKNIKHFQTQIAQEKIEFHGVQ